VPTAFLQIDSEFGPHARPIVTWNVADKKVFSRRQIDGQCVGFAGIKLRNLALRREWGGTAYPPPAGLALKFFMAASR
jgi:hypothetical protein